MVIKLTPTWNRYAVYFFVMRVLTPLIMCSLVVMHAPYTRVCERLSSVYALGFIIYYVFFFVFTWIVARRLSSPECGSGICVLCSIWVSSAYAKTFLPLMVITLHHLCHRQGRLLQTSKLILYALTLRF